MKVKVGNKIYDGENEPVMVILSDKDKENIKRMPSDKTKYCSFPEKSDIGKIEEWMKEPTD